MARMGAFFLTFMLLAVGVEANAQQIAVARYDSDLYVRTPYPIAGFDKVWRLKIEPPVDWKSSGVTDFIGERLIPSETENKLAVSMYHRSKHILRYGGDESPPMWINGKIAGGNHPLNGKHTVHDYEISLQVDGQAAAPGSQPVTGSELLILESYSVDLGDGVTVANVTNQYRFSASPFVNSSFTVSVREPLESIAFGGMQFQRPYTAEGERLFLYVPSSSWEKGIDITDPANELTLSSNLWDASSIPNKFTVEVHQGERVMRKFIMEYDAGMKYDRSSPIPAPESLFYRSARGKMYPKAVRQNQVKSGQSFTVSGKFGFVPSDYTSSKR